MDKNFWVSLSIVLGTIAIGLASYLFYSSRININKESPRCEYNGWAYADKEIYESIDGCNTCFCDDGETVCTEMACE
jgi:hypothetical protein